MNAKWLLLTVGIPVVAMLRATSGPLFEHVLPLKPEEGVFAYARISPDGKFVVYASEVGDSADRDAFRRTVTVVHLSTKKILFAESGIDAYWSPDGDRMIYQSFRGDHKANIRNHITGVITRDIAPVALGDYYSWGRRDGRDLILTITGHYFYLSGEGAQLPADSIRACPGIGVGERPLLSKDGRQVTVFVRGTVVVRNLTDCRFILDTGIHGAKADFSWDGRYLALHAPKTDGVGYEIDVIDLRQRTIRTITHLTGSSFFPSWTRDGRLCFRYDGDDYRGFIVASNVLDAPARPLRSSADRKDTRRGWSDIFPETARPPHDMNVVMVWGTWSAHSSDALVDLQRAHVYFDQHGMDVGVEIAADPGSEPSDVQRILARLDIGLSQLPLAGGRLSLTEADNQVPATLLFKNGALVDRRLGAQSLGGLRRWVESLSGARR